MAYRNRWGTSQEEISKRQALLKYLICGLIGAGCVFSTGAHAALIENEMFGSGDVLYGNTDLVWIASSNGINCPRPLPAGAEQVQGSYSEDFVTQGGSYEAVTTINNLEIIQQDTARKFSMKDGLYTESSAYYGVGQSANPAITCGNYETAVASATPTDEAAAEAAGNTTPLTATAYCEMVMSSNMITGPGQYQSQTHIQALDITPDAFSISAAATGVGSGTMTISGYSNAGLFNTTTLGYHNEFHQSVSGAGAFQVGEKFQWTSFKNTFDFPETTG